MHYLADTTAFYPDITKKQKCRRVIDDLSGYKTPPNAGSGIDEERDQIAESSAEVLNPKKVTKMRKRSKD